MAKRGIPVKQLTIEIPIFDRFRSFARYGESNQYLLVYIMDLADKELQRKNQPRINGKFTKED